MRALLRLWAVPAALGLLLPLAGHAAPCAANHAPAFAEAPLAMPKAKRVGLALGSGSMHGLAHVGVIQELEARGVRIDVVAGTSVGALVGALWASGLDGARIAALHREGRLGDWSGFARSWQGVLTNEGLRSPLESAFRQRPIGTWPRRFGAVATNIANGERRILSSGSGASAVIASSAVPVLFTPAMIDGEHLVDGALVEPVPVDAARVLGADIVIGVDVAYRPDEEAASGITQYAFQAMHILINSLASAQLRSADVAIRMNLHQRYMRCGDEALIDAGRQAVRDAWPAIARVFTASR